MQLLHHPGFARQTGIALGGRRAARGGEAGEGGRKGTARHLAGHVRLRDRPALRRKRVRRPLGAREIPRPDPRTVLARRLGAPALCLSLSPCGRGGGADGPERRQWQSVALSRHPLPARIPARPQSDAPPGQSGKDARPREGLAPSLPRSGDPLHLHRGLPRRDRGGFRNAARLAGRSAPRPGRRLQIRARAGRDGQ